MTTVSNRFTISRVLDAPLDLVWKVHTEPKHLVNWWGPKGFNMTANQFDLQIGGIFHYRMEAADGNEMWGKFVYREIVPQEKLVFVLSFSNADGDTAPAPMAETWPLEIRYTILFEEQDNKTLVTITGHPINASETEEAAFENELEGMSEGFGISYAQLVKYLESVG